MVKSWDRIFKQVGQRATPVVSNYHPHRFRDTFAVSLLLKGVSLDSVSKLLGHRSIKVTERHYAPWVKAPGSTRERSPSHLELTRTVGPVRRAHAIACPS